MSLLDRFRRDHEDGAAAVARHAALAEGGHEKAAGRPPAHEQHPLSPEERELIDRSLGEPGGPGGWFE